MAFSPATQHVAPEKLGRCVRNIGLKITLPLPTPLCGKTRETYIALSRARTHGQLIHCYVYSRWTECVLSICCLFTLHFPPYESLLSRTICLKITCLIIFSTRWDGWLCVKAFFDLWKVKKRLNKILSPICNY